MNNKLFWRIQYSYEKIVFVCDYLIDVGSGNENVLKVDWWRLFLLLGGVNFCKGAMDLCFWE